MIVLGLIGRTDVAGCHDATASLVIDGRVVAVLEQERVSGRRFAPGESPERAVEALLAACDLHAEQIDAIGYAWADAPDGSRSWPADTFGDVRVTDQLTDVVLPTLGSRLRCRDIMFFDHHLCHAAQTYWCNAHDRADVLVADGTGGGGSTSLFRVVGGTFTLLDRYPHVWSLGIFYEAAAHYAGLGWDAAGKLMGLSSYARRSDRRYLRFDAEQGAFALGRDLHDVPPGGLSADGLAHRWNDIFRANCFPYRCAGGNPFDYVNFAADVQATLEDVGMALARRLRGRSGLDALLLAGGVALNAHLNRRLAAESGYASVSSTSAPHDGGAAMGAGLLAAALLGEPVATRALGEPGQIFLGPPPDRCSIDRVMRSAGARVVDHDQIPHLIAQAIARDHVVAYADGRPELGPRALGARSLLAGPRSRDTLDRLNRVKSRAAWRPAAISLTTAGFDRLAIEPPIDGLTEYMLCAHGVAEEHWSEVAAGVHVDGTTRAQHVLPNAPFATVLAAVEDETGLPAVVNTSLNLRGRPMVLAPEDALELFAVAEDVDVLVVPPYVVSRR